MNPDLIAAGEFKDDGMIEDNDLRVKDQERDEHIGFIRKVLGIVACQMALTFLFSLAASADQSTGQFMRSPTV